MINSYKNWFLALSLMTLVALLELPYFYYQLLRWVVCLGSTIICYKLNERNQKVDWSLVVISIIFNPIAPFYFGVFLWKFIDLITGLWFVFLYFKYSKEKN